MSDTLSKHIDRLIRTRPLYKDALSAYRDLIDFLERSSPEVTYILNDQKIRDLKTKEGFPLFSREALPFDLKAASSLFQRLVEHVSLQKRKDKDALKKLLDKVRADSRLVEKIFTALLSRDEASLAAQAAEVMLEPMVLKFLIHMALKPSLNALCESVGESIQKDSWQFGYCPLCGSSPDIAYLNDQGKRFLHCELCGTEWYYPRLKCPFCENDDHKKLEYFTPEDAEGFRVDFCKKCNSYIKTLDMRIIESPAPLDLENLTTLHLDMLAHEQGFKTGNG